jgi:hypothetical protein
MTLAASHLWLAYAAGISFVVAVLLRLAAAYTARRARREDD